MSNGSIPRASCDVAIIGAGPAGVICGAALERAGLDVQLFEAQRFPRFVIGESLLPRCMDVMQSVGLLEDVAAQGYQRKFGAAFLWEDTRLDFDFSQQFSEGWSYTWQVPRAHFDDVLAKALVRRGVAIHFEHSVKAVTVGESPSLDVESADGTRYQVAPRYVVDASGYGRVLPRLLGLDRPSMFPPRKAVFTHVRGDRLTQGSEVGRIWIVSHSLDAWTWLIPFSNGITSVGTVGAVEFFDRFEGTPNDVLRAILASSPLTRERLGGVEFTFDAKVISSYSVKVERVFGDNFCLVGNATEFLDPVFSSGVTLAMESGYRASQLIARQLGGETIDWQSEYAAPMQSGTDVFRTYVEGWYDGTLPKIFRAPDPPDKFKRMICSVLAGYVWDETNPFVAQHARKVKQLAQLVG